MSIKPLLILFSRLCLLIASTLFIYGCSEDTAEKLAAQTAVVIESGDECHLCGMIISNFPGPKGQLYERGQNSTMKFCSTRDMFAYLLDPEHQHNIQTAYVHDMAITPWDHPDQETYIDAKKAWYVIGSNKPGAMGPTLGSFSTEANAKAFADLNGGKLYKFDDLTLEMISAMSF
ncbi:MAG: nitrous oxide reductase accessory protein NosL [Motiliproteus sp.]